MKEEIIIKRAEAQALLDYIEELETDFQTDEYYIASRAAANKIINILRDD